MCYNRPAVERAAKTPFGPARPAGGSARSERGEIPPEESAPVQGAASAYEDASRHCPVCSERLEARRCKLICLVCGYYMSCADYY